MSRAPFSMPRTTRAAPGDPPVLVLRRSSDVFYHGGLAVARSLGRLGAPVHLAQEGRAPDALSRYVRGTILLDPGADDEAWMSALLGAGKRLGPTVLVAADDAAAVFLDDHASQLGEHFLFPVQSPGVHRRLSSKRQMHELCGTLGVATPRSRLPTSEREVLASAEELGFPLVVKQSDGWLQAREADAPSVLIVRDHAELLAAAARMDSPVQPNLLLQEHVAGGSDKRWVFNGYFGRSGECLFYGTGRKLRQRGPHTGPITLGECRACEPVAEAARRLVREVRYRGLIDIDFRLDDRDGTYKLLDVNPRLGGSFRMFVGEDGLDVMRALYLDMTGRQVPASRARDGRVWVVEPYDLVSSWQMSRQGGLGLRSWLRSLTRIRETAWFAWDDLKPVGALTVHLVRRGAQSLRPGRRSAG